MSHIFLYGPSGVGKSTIGKSLACNLNLPLLDSDAVIESKAGISIPEIMQKYGEPILRDYETTALKEIVDGPDRVIALGGGALLREENRLLAESNGNVVLLMAELSILLERLQNDKHERPLLAGDLESKLTEYLESRAEHYASFPLKVQVDGKAAEQIAHQVQVMLGRFHLSAMGEYDVIVDSVHRLTKSLYQSLILVTDENVARSHPAKIESILRASGYESKSVILPAGEEHKNLETVSRLWKTFLESGLDRKSTVIALGGGVVTDLAGFAASTYMRGIDWIAVPTTLLSMVDAALGGKTGFDLPEGKNLIGSFHPPKLVLVDAHFLSTLPERELISGMAEVVKHGIISDPALFALCSRGMDWVRADVEEIVKRAIAVKIEVIENDPYEKGYRAALNLGHTVGHAVELVSQFQLRHGEAIAIGMVMEAKYAERIGVAEKGVADAIAEVLGKLGLPTRIPNALPREEIFRAMQVDKKRNAKTIRFALPSDIGKVELVDVMNVQDVLLK